MGRQDVYRDPVPRDFRAFTKTLLKDLAALEQMLQQDLFERNVRRIGAEQELFLVDEGWRPHLIAEEVLSTLGSCQFTTELARFNLEINLQPLLLTGSCFATLEADLRRLLGIVQNAAARHHGHVVLTGILPTLMQSDLSLESMTPRDRYYALNDAITRMTGGAYRFHLQGTDELHMEHDSVMLEGCNTSFQVHLQVAPDEFAQMYNTTQALAGPILAACVNSPLLFGKRLWAETRIALFQRSIDTRQTTPHLRELTPRVRFGERWVQDSVVELFQEDIARIPALLGSRTDEDPLKVLRDGGIPQLDALQLYNSTVYRWNRPCYGVLDAKPHLRIECRVLPSGPSVQDEAANAAFWVGAVLGANAKYGDFANYMDFADARGNLVAAARRGLSAGFTWIDGRTVSAPDLINDELLNLAKSGLESAHVDAADIDKYLETIEYRVNTCRTGTCWMLNSLSKMGNDGTRTERLAALTEAVAHQQLDRGPVHTWRLAKISKGDQWRRNYLRVEQYMTTDLFTVRKDELLDLAALLMEWKRIRQLPVEDDQQQLVGLISFGAVLRHLAISHPDDRATGLPVAEAMDPSPITVEPETSTREAMRLMRKHKVTALPVVKDGKLVGIVSMDDFLPIAERLLDEHLEQ